MTIALWTLILMESLFIVGHLVKVAYYRPELRLTAYVLLAWAVHRLVFIIISILRSTGVLFVSDNAMFMWTIILMAQFVSTLLGILVCYIALRKRKPS